jgi:putative oxidoreductase
MQTLSTEHGKQFFTDLSRQEKENKQKVSLTGKNSIMKHLLGYQALNSNLAALLLRLVVGGLFVRYGYMKASAYNNILPMFQDIIGIGAKLSFDLVIFAELVCGFLVLIGFVTRLSVIPIFITMIVAYFVAHQNDPFDMKAIAFVFLCLSVVVFVLGSGKYSVDGLLFKKKPQANG